MKLGLKSGLYNAEIRNRRLELGLTQKQLARAVGLHSQTIGRMETFRITNPKSPNVVKLAEYFGVSPETICPEWLKLMDLIPKKVDKQAEFEGHMLEGKVAEQALLPRTTRATQEAETNQRLLAEQIESVLHTLSFREREIIKLRYGIGTGYTYTMTEVARIFKVSTTRVRQVEAKAIKKLSHPVRAVRLEEFLPDLPDDVSGPG